jgi:hypothetical protein
MNEDIFKQVGVFAEFFLKLGDFDEIGSGSYYNDYFIHSTVLPDKDIRK